MSKDILTAKLSVIDRRCEDAARSEVDTLFSTARYESGRFHVPDLTQVTKIYLKNIECKESQFNSEIHRIFSPDHALNIARQEAIDIVDDYFHESHYIKRLEVFIDSINRHASRYGVTHVLTENSTELARAAYYAAIKNRLRLAIACVDAELELHYPEEPLRGWHRLLQRASKYLNLKPGVFGMGINFNALIDKWTRKRN